MHLFCCQDVLYFSVNIMIGFFSSKHSHVFQNFFYRNTQIDNIFCRKFIQKYLCLIRLLKLLVVWDMKEPFFVHFRAPLSGCGLWHMSGRSVYRDWPRTSSPIVHQVIQQVDGQGEHDGRVLFSRNVSLKKKRNLF